jgi:Zn-dependent M28 family amino/carboxypeptidase
MLWLRERPSTHEILDRPRDVAPAEDRLRASVARLAVPRHHVVNARANAWVRDELARAFEDCGLDVKVQGRYRNVIALPRGPQRRPLTLVAAHYDSVPDCPGADDNASGLAVMLECARSLSLQVPGHPLGFIAFNAEEDGLLGSRDFVDTGLPALGIGIRAVHVLEMVGFRGGSAPQAIPLPWVPSSLKTPDFIGLVGKGRSNASVDRALAQAVAPSLRILAAKTWGPLHRLVPDLTRSDHFPFWDAKLSALLWTDTGNFRNPHYHRKTDTKDTLDYSFMQSVGELLCAVVAEEARL